MLSETGVDAAGHHIADANVVIAQVLHDSFAESIQTKLRCVISRSSLKRVLPGQTADIDDVSATTLLEIWDGGVAAVEHSGKIGIDDLLPLFRGDVADACKQADRRVIDEDI